MAQSISFTGTDDLRAAEWMLSQAAVVAPDDARKIVSKGSLNIKNDAKRRVTGLAHAPAYPRSITYDTKATPGGAVGEVGPDKGRRQGALGNFLEYGSVNNAPTPHLAPASALEEPRFVKAMEDAALKALGL